MSGVTRVGVLPTHTRRGVLSGMIERLLRDARADGRVLAGLRASEAVIYGRFGFGMAGEANAVRVRSRLARPVRAVPEGSVRLVAREEILETVEDVYDRCGRWRTGAVSRPRWMHERALEDALGGTKSSYVAVHEDPCGALDGYVHYSTQWDDSDNDEVGRGRVHALFGANVSVERALWSYLVGIDLIDEWRTEESPVHDAIRFAFADMRAYKVRDTWDEQWLRLLDVDAALRARTYRAAEGAVVIGVEDPWFADNRGTWRIDRRGAERTDDAPDLSGPIDVISAAYLGGTSWRDLADAGALTVHRLDGVATADNLFAEYPTPFCGTFY
jgi:predicted acetyltransferase